MAEPSYERDERVLRVMRLEAEGKWAPATAHELAREWKQTPDSVYAMHAEACRFVRLASAGNIDEERNTWLTRLHAVYASAMQRETVEHIYNPAKQEIEEFKWRDPDHKAAVQAITQACKVLGLGMFKKDELEDRERSQLRDTLGKQNVGKLRSDLQTMLLQLDAMEAGMSN